MLNELRSVGPSEQDKWYEDLIESLQRQSLDSNVLNLKAVQLALKELGKEITADISEGLWYLENSVFSLLLISPTVPKKLIFFKVIFLKIVNFWEFYSVYRAF